MLENTYSFTEDKGEMQEKARKDKEVAGEEAKKSYRRSYGVYRRVGLKPLCAVRFMFQHKLGF